MLKYIKQFKKMNNVTLLNNMNYKHPTIINEQHDKRIFGETAFEKGMLRF